VLPAAGLLLRLGQPDLLNIPVMAQAGDAIFSNLPLLFALGVGIGLAEQAGVAGLAALVGYVVFQKTLTTINEDLNMGVLAGILTGALAAAMYNRYHNIRLPEWLGFFGRAPVRPAGHRLLGPGPGRGLRVRSGDRSNRPSTRWATG